MIFAAIITLGFQVKSVLSIIIWKFVSIKLYAIWFEGVPDIYKIMIVQ